MIRVPLSNLRKTSRNINITGDIRYRCYTLHPLSTSSTHSKTIWLFFFSGHGDTLDIFDTFINQLYETLLSNRTKHEHCTIHMIAYDRIGYGGSDSLSAVNGNSVCISPPTFTSITAYDRALEFQSFLMRLQIDGTSFRSFDDELILIGHGYGGLVAQSFVTIICADLQSNSQELQTSSQSSDKQLPNITLFLMESAWVDMDKCIGKFEVKQLDCYKDYCLTLLGLQSPNMFHKYPSFDELKQMHPNYEAEIVSNIGICKFYRAYGDQMISKWNELLGLWSSMDMLGEDITMWTQFLNNVKLNYNINLRICNLYSNWNEKWTVFQERLLNEIDTECLVHNECITDCSHYVHLHRPDIVLRRLQMIIQNVATLQHVEAH